MVTLAVEETLSQSARGGANPLRCRLHVHSAVFNASALLLLLLPPLPPPCPEGLSEESVQVFVLRVGLNPVLACPWAALSSQASESSWIGEMALMCSLAPGC